MHILQVPVVLFPILLTFPYPFSLIAKRSSVAVWTRSTSCVAAFVLGREMWRHGVQLLVVFCLFCFVVDLVVLAETKASGINCLSTTVDDKTSTNMVLWCCERKRSNLSISRLRSVRKLFSIVQRHPESVIHLVHWFCVACSFVVHLLPYEYQLPGSASRRPVVYSNTHRLSHAFSAISPTPLSSSAEDRSEFVLQARKDNRVGCFGVLHWNCTV